MCVKQGVRVDLLIIIWIREWVFGARSGVKRVARKGIRRKWQFCKDFLVVVCELVQLDDDVN